jgi:hypothetical protein
MAELLDAGLTPRATGCPLGMSASRATELETGMATKRKQSNIFKARGNHSAVMSV